ncbi:HFL339Cp [Eremothecium sinecaudum]|uniref:HFL339Cp n=1 Tax=Eremothecium sinecaudum TaxID=45286 RepID=A0A0X8HU15_9SACH|nr:HFL339Cp [Eremothecium sinecaudum]AMD21517.1 HFL339Cp [Eremothecium sinecaudum]
MSGIELYNLTNGSEVYSPALIIHGRCHSPKARYIDVLHNSLPSLRYEVNAQGFKALVHMVRGQNVLTFVTSENEQLSISTVYAPQMSNPPIHLCILVGRDSPLEFDSPATQKAKEGGNGLELAIAKLRCGARLMQAFTNEQLLRSGFGHRCFRFVEEGVQDTLFRIPEQRETIKIHVLRSRLTTAEIRDPNIAQQNEKATNRAGLFGVAMDALRDYGGVFSNPNETAQAAVLFLDSHWDPKLKLIRGHAALGGGDSKIKLAIFGSHGLYSWPKTIEDVPMYFTDTTPISPNEVANDCNECGTHWECLTVTLGAFMHEIGHLLGCPHQENGVMLRDYVRLNRSFLTREAYCTRTRNHGAAPPIFPVEECTWHRLDLIRFLFHPSFTIPSDYKDPAFMKPGKLGNSPYPRSSFYPLGNGQGMITSMSGIYCIELVCDDIACSHLEYLPQSVGGIGTQREVLVTLDELRAKLPPTKLAKHRNTFKLKVHSVNAEPAEFSNFPKLVESSFISLAQYGYPPHVSGVKSSLLGSDTRGQDIGIIPVNMDNVNRVRVYHGGALDGVRFYFREEHATLQPSPNKYLSRFKESVSSFKPPNSNEAVLFGRQTSNYTDFVLKEGEKVVGFNVKSGFWVDAIQVIASSGRASPMLGNAAGGGAGSLIPPQGSKILGLYGRVGQWVDSIGIIYGVI